MKKCKPDESEHISIIHKLISENQELRSFLMEQTKNTNDLVNKALESCKSASITNTTINGNLNKFNIQIFLNETCKDAINFSDFDKNIQISYEDLENNAQLGFVNGISKIFLDNLRQLDVCERPIHCTDLKRETIYILKMKTNGVNKSMIQNYKKPYKLFLIGVWENYQSGNKIIQIIKTATLNSQISV
jgi:hypothetical protein